VPRQAEHGESELQAPRLTRPAGVSLISLVSAGAPLSTIGAAAGLKAADRAAMGM
jgi:hypothetical protein